MIDKTKKSKSISGDKKFFMLILLLWAGLATPLVKFYSPEFPYILGLNLLVLFVFYNKYKVVKTNSLLILVSVYAGWYGLICLKYGGIQSVDFTLVYSALIAYVSYKVFPNIKDFFVCYEKVLVGLAVLSLIVWGSASLMPFMANLYDRFAIYRVQGLENSSYVLVGYGHQMAGVLHRNLGFAWEAGRFASFLVLGIFFNLLNHNLKISLKSNRNFWILSAALVSTFSTTGFASLGGVILFYFFNKSNYSKLVLAIVGIITLPTIVALPFIGEKFTDNMDYNQEISNMLYSFQYDGTGSITPQRITGFYLEALNFIHDPLLGYNVNEKSYVMMHIFKGFDVWLSDGILQIFSKYGIILGICFYVMLFKSSAYMSDIYKTKGKYFFALVFILISCSYDFWGTGLTFYMVFYTYFNKSNKKRYASRSVNYSGSV